MQVHRINLKPSQQHPITSDPRVRVRARGVVRVYIALHNNQYRQTGSTPWVYPQLGVQKSLQFIGGAHDAWVFRNHSRLGSSSTRNKAPGIQQRARGRPSQPGARQRKERRVTPKAGHGLVETAEAERLDVYLRSLRYVQPNSYLVSDAGGINVAVSRRYSDSPGGLAKPTTILLQHQDAEGVGAVSSMFSVRQKKTTKNDTSIFGAMGIGKFTRSTLDDSTCIAEYQPGLGEGAEKLSDTETEKLDAQFKVGMPVCLQPAWLTTATLHSTHPRRRDGHQQEPHRFAVARLQ